MTLGANANITLGYSFVTAEVDDDPASSCMAELEALLDADVETVRIGASGDMWLEEQEPRLFTVASRKMTMTKTPRRPKKSWQKRRSASPASKPTRPITWPACGVRGRSAPVGLPVFALPAGVVRQGRQNPVGRLRHAARERIRRYAQEYQPVRYEVVTEPNAYAEYSGIDLPEDEAEQLELWVAHTEALRDAVHEASPETQVGVAIAIQDDFDLDYYERILALDGIDFISFRVYQPAAFDVIEDILAERGRPQDNGKELWLAETWYGYCLAPQRSMDLDPEWLEVVVAFALKDRSAA